MNPTNDVVFTEEQNQENDKFNYLGAISILELAGRRDLLDLINAGDWRCLPKVYNALSKMIIDTGFQSDEENGADILEAYFNIIKANMGVSSDNIEDVPKILKKLKIYADSEEKFILDSMIECFEESEFISLIMIAGQIVQKGTVLSALVHDCSDLILRSINIVRNSGDTSDEEE